VNLFNVFISVLMIINTIFLYEPVNSELRLAVLNFVGFSASMFLIKKNYYNASSFNICYMKFLFVLAQLGAAVIR